MKNIAITYPYDLLMGTAMKPRVHEADFEIFREESKDDKSYKVCFVPLDRGNGGTCMPKRQSISLSGIDFSGLEFEE